MDKTEFIHWGNQSSTFSRKSPHEFFCPTDTVICRECEPSAVLACYLRRNKLLNRNKIHYVTQWLALQYINNHCVKDRCVFKKCSQCWSNRLLLHLTQQWPSWKHLHI